MQPFQKKENSTDFSNPAVQQAYVQNIDNNKTLMRKEIDVNKAEQNLLRQRIDLMKSLANDIPSSDPQYSLFVVQAEMDQVEMDELKSRELILHDKLSKFESSGESYV
ncbi:MAG: hypothetical protein WCF19_02830 [Chlamydiales bacterium]